MSVTCSSTSHVVYEGKPEQLTVSNVKGCSMVSLVIVAYVTGSSYTVIGDVIITELGKLCAVTLVRLVARTS